MADTFTFFHYENKPIQRNNTNTEELAQTPSSSTLSFITNEKESVHGLLSEKASLLSHYSSYGSIEATTISPNDDDEGLYLLWTHQLLKERGYEPSPLKKIMEDNDNCSIESSITGRSIVVKSWFSACFPFC